MFRTSRTLRSARTFFFAGCLFLLTTPRHASAAAGVLREVYTGISGSALSDLTNNAAYPSRPTLEEIRPDFEAPAQWGEDYGQRLRALLVPPATGNYIFWIASDDQGALFLSPDEDPSHRRRIAGVNGWTNEREWAKEASQKSSPVALQAGRRYYVEALQKEGSGGDHLAVRWQLPSGTLIEPIRGSNLVVVGLAPPIITAQPTNTTVIEAETTSFTVTLGRYIGAGFQWFRNGAALNNATNSTLIVGPVSLADSTNRFHVVVTNSLGAATSVVARVTVNRDLTPPRIVSAVNLGDPGIVSVLFSEALETSSATRAANYTLDRGARVLTATLGTAPNIVVLHTTLLDPEGDYVLAVSGVRDRASQPVSITPGSQARFTLAGEPMDVARLDGMPEPLGPSTRRGSIIVSEIHYHPPARVDGRSVEFIELYNTQPWPEDISGWKLSGEVDHAFVPGTVIRGRTFLVLAAVPADVEATYGIAGVLEYSGHLKGGGGTVRLHNERGAVMWDVTYHSTPPWPVAADGAGHSLVLARPSLGESDPAAWQISNQAGGSAGTGEPQSTLPSRTLRINEFLAHTDEPQKDFIELYNYGNSAVPLAGLALTDDPSTNRFLLPSTGSIPPRGFAVFDQDQLGFSLDAAGETLVLRDAPSGRVIDAIRFGGQANGVSRGRVPDGAQQFSELTTPTPGSANAPRLQRPVILHEIMFEPADGSTSGEFVELFNRGSTTVPLAGWRLAGGVDFTFPEGSSIAPGGLLVVAKNAASLRALHPSLDATHCLGDFAGSLGNSGDHLELTQPDAVISTHANGQSITNVIHIVMDEVDYQSGGRWPSWSAGGGSSLERIDPRADGRLAGAWAASDESTRSEWVTVESTGTLDLGISTASSLEIMLLGSGECLIDDVQVFRVGEANRVPNGDFSAGLKGWVPQGNQSHSEWRPSGGTSDSPCLLLRATGRGDTANRVRVPFTTAMPAGAKATIRARARWLRGTSEILLRIHGSWLEAATNILTTRALGTPGTPSRSPETNAGPSIRDVLHQPVLPSNLQAVSVSAQVADPDGLSSLHLRFRVDPGTNWNTVAMARRGAGLYSGIIPGQNTGTLVAFYIEAADAAASPATSRFPSDAPDREALIRWGEPGSDASFGTYRIWVSQRTLDVWRRRERLSNDLLDTTFVLGRDRVSYNVGARYSGSPYHAPGYDSPTGNYCDYQLTFPTDDLFLGETDVNLLLPGNGCCDGTMVREQMTYAIARKLDVPFNHTRHVRVFLNGIARAPMMMIDSQQANGDFTRQWWPDAPSGDLHKVALWFEFNDEVTTFEGSGASFGNFTSGGVKKLARYRWNWPRRAAQHDINIYTNLYALHDAMLSTSTGATYARRIEGVIDPDNWARTVAIEHIVGNNDSFAYGGGQNMFVYKPAGDRWSWLLWDIDFAFQSETPTTSVFNFGGAELDRLLKHPPFYRMYYRALRDALDGPCSPAFYTPFLNYRESAFRAAGFTPDSTSSIRTYLAARSTYLRQTLDRVATTLRVTSPANIVAIANPVTLLGVAPIEVTDILVNGESWPVQWTTLTNWTLRLALTPGTHPLMLQGVTSTGTILGGTTNRVSVSFNGPSDPALGNVLINEWMAANNGTLADPATGTFEDWFELHNTGSTAVNLGGYFLSNSTTNRSQSRIPDGITVPAHDFLVAWADNHTNAIPAGSLHVSFKLKHAGETLALFNPSGLLIDSVEFGAQEADIASGRFPDGASTEGPLLRPTPGAPNAPLLEAASARIVAEWDPATGLINLIWTAVAGLGYRVEFTGDVASGFWQSAGSIVSHGATAAMTLDARGPEARFFRVITE